MDERMRLGEGHLAGIGKMCNSGLLERKALNMHSLVEAVGATGTIRCRSAELADCRGVPTDLS